METKSFSLDLKEIDEVGHFTGYASVYGNQDEDGDIVCKGAFKRSIDQKGGIVPILWQHDTKEPIGWNQKANEDERGLFVDGLLMQEDPKARKAREFMLLAKKVGAKAKLSIGYRVVKQAYDKGVRLLKELELLEYSIVTFPANNLAEVTGIKSAISFQDLPLAEESRGWDAGAARGRIKAWAGGNETDWTKARKCFLWHDAANPEDWASYRLPIADIIDGVATAIPRGIVAAAARLQTAPMVPPADLPKVKAHLERYCKKMGKDSPFGDKTMASTDFNANNDHAAAMDEIWSKRYAANHALSDTLDAIHGNDDMDDNAKAEAMRKARHDHADAHADLDKQELDANAKLTSENKAGRAISTATMAKIKSAAACYSSAMDHHREAMKMHKSGDRMMKDLMDGGTSPGDSETGTMSGTPADGTKDNADPAGGHSATLDVSGFRERFKALMQ